MQTCLGKVSTLVGADWGALEQVPTDPMLSAAYGYEASTAPAEPELPEPEPETPEPEPVETPVEATPVEEPTMATQSAPVEPQPPVEAPAPPAEEAEVLTEAEVAAQLEVIVAVDPDDDTLQVEIGLVTDTKLDPQAVAMKQQLADQQAQRRKDPPQDAGFNPLWCLAGLVLLPGLALARRKPKAPKAPEELAVSQASAKPQDLDVDDRSTATPSDLGTISQIGSIEAIPAQDWKMPAVPVEQRQELADIEV